MLNMGNLFNERDKIFVFSRVRSTSKNIKSCPTSEIHSIFNVNLEFSVCYIFLGFRHVSLKSWTLHAIHDVTAVSMKISLLPDIEQIKTNKITLLIKYCYPLVLEKKYGKIYTEFLI